MRAILAYIDPGTGATITQLLLAGTVGIAAVVKLKWHSIRMFFSRFGRSEDEDGDEKVESGADSDEVSVD